jgi:hypothetical protein
MQIVLIALLYTTTIAQPHVYASAYAYSNIQDCLQDAEEVKTRLMETAPNSDSYVNVQCVVMPRST